MDPYTKLRAALKELRLARGLGLRGAAAELAVCTDDDLATRVREGDLSLPMLLRLLVIDNHDVRVAAGGRVRLPLVSDVPIDEFLAGLGLTGDEAAEARQILEREGLTNPRKQNIAIGKTPLAQQAIDTHLRRLCHTCVGRAGGDGRKLARVPRNACSACNGSSNARAVGDMVAACRSAGLDRVVFVGGSPATREELKELVGENLKLRLVDGTISSDKQTARKNIAWSDLIVVLGATELAHKVSLLYTNSAKAKGKLVTTSRRGIEAIADDATRFNRGLP